MISLTAWKEEFVKLYDQIDGSCRCSECKESIIRKNTSQLIQVLFDSVNVTEIPFRYMIRNRRNARVTYPVIQNLYHDYAILYENFKRLININMDTTGTPCRLCGVIHPHSKEVDIKQGDIKLTVTICPKCMRDFKLCISCGVHCAENSRRTVVWKNITTRNKYGSLSRERQGDLNGDDNDYYTRLCDDCVREKTGYCGHCGYTYYLKDLVIGEGIRNQDWIVKDTYICNRCAKTTICDSCGKETLVPYGHGSQNLCLSCYEDQKLVHDHTYRPFHIRYLKGSKEGAVSEQALRFGVEIEAENVNSFVDRSAMSALIKDRFGYDWLYCVHDGTVRGGSEFVSYPFTWQHFLETRDKWIEFFLLLQKHQWTGNGSRCGFHVHTTKAAWTSYQLYKLCKFIYEPNNHPFITAIAQRQFNRFCCIDENDAAAIADLAKLKKNKSPEHYNAINLNSSQTIEFRFFQGSLEPWYFFKNVEFVKSLYDYTQTYNVKQMNTKDYTAHILSNKKKYYYLRTFIEEYVIGTAFKKQKKKNEMERLFTSVQQITVPRRSGRRF